MAHYILKNYASASALYAESLRLRRELGDRYGVAVSLQGMAVTAQVQGDAAEAERLARESLLLFRELEDKEGIAECLRVYGALNHQKRDSVKATRLYGAAEALRKSFGLLHAPAERADFDRQIAAVRAALGEDAFTCEWDVGLALKWEQAAAYALDDDVPIVR